MTIDPDDDPDGTARALASQAIANRIAGILAGLPCEVQGAALADIVACWIAGHVGAPDGRPLANYRVEILTEFIELVGALVPFHDRRTRDGQSFTSTGHA